MRRECEIVSVSGVVAVIVSECTFLLGESMQDKLTYEQHLSETSYDLKHF